MVLLFGAVAGIQKVQLPATRENSVGLHMRIGFRRRTQVDWIPAPHAGGLYSGGDWIPAAHADGLNSGGTHGLRYASRMDSILLA